ncbi:MAG: methyltransferase domain-containing protein [Azospirillaceae bacterium]|nr:methyltransferase domain-containing protein [Azospirillaceae bacterium]
MAKAPEHAPQWKRRFIAWWEGYELAGGDESGADGADGSRGSGSRGAPPAVVNDKPKAGISRFGKPLWSANRIQVAEKIWGEGFVTPGSQDYIPNLLKPLGLNPAMSVLDLSAGLGGVVRIMATRYGVWTTGFEASQFLAEQGMARSVKHGQAKQAPISHYDPENFVAPKRFDAIFAKEFLFSVRNIEAMTDAIEAGLKSRGQLLFTDYVIEREGSRGKALQAWYDHEPLAPHPRTLHQITESLQQRNLDLRITEDITEVHRTTILTGIQALSDHLSSHHTDKETKVAVLEEVELWARRVAALQDGLRVYRIFALKPNVPGDT